MSLTDLNDQGRFSHSAVCVHGQEELAYVHGELVFTQLIDQLPMHTFRRCIQRYGGNQYVKRFTCQDQYRCMAFAQLTYRESLRDIEACLRAQHNKLYIDEDFGVELDHTQTFIFANNPST